jgi:hypothetical protein
MWIADAKPIGAVAPRSPFRSKNSGKQRITASLPAVISFADPPAAQDFCGERAAARCYFLEEQRKTAGVDPEPLLF